MAEQKELAVFLDTKAKAPECVFIIERSKNKNIVVYEGHAKDGKIDPTKPVEVYWLNIDPEYVKETRAKGIQHDRTEINMLESKFAYGVSAKATDEPNEFLLSLVALPSKKVWLTTDAEGKPIAIIEINGKRAKLQKIFVNSQDRWVGLPKVIFVDIFGYDLESNQFVSERITP